METLIQVEGLTKSFGKRLVLDNLSFSINRGDLIGLVGLNGGGKTTLFKCITGLLYCKGNINILGYSLKKKSKIFEKLLFIFDKEVYLGEMSGYIILEDFVRLYRKPNKDEIMSVMSEVGLQGREKDPVKRYSLGMKQRLNIAKILLAKPEIVIMDEPFNGVDIDGVEYMIDVIKRANKEFGTVFIVSSHQITELEKFCNRVMVIGKHRLLADKYIDDDDTISIGIKLINPDDMDKLKSEFEYVRNMNDVAYFNIDKTKVSSFTDYLNDNKITYSYLNTENSIKSEVMSLLGEEAV